MAHEIETMAYANAVPWHGLGAKVGKDVTAEEMLEAAGLNWKVKMCPMTAEFEGEHIPVDGRFALIRDKDKKVMTIASEYWKPVQNSDMLAFMKQFVESGGATLETAGALRGGQVVWALANLNHSYEARPGDKVKGYLLMTSSHIVGRATTTSTTQVRVVCANTLAAAERAHDVHYKQNHLTEFNFEKAKERVMNAHEELSKAEAVAKSLAALKLSVKDAVEKVFAPILFPKEDLELILPNIDHPDELPKTLNEILDSYHNAPGADPGTGWGAMNAITHYTDHVAGREASARLFNSWMGTNAKVKIKIQDKLMELV